MRAISTLAAALLMTMGGVAFAEHADATRPIVGYPYKDMCRNIPGKQPIYMTIGTGPYRIVKPGICRRR